MGAWGVLCPSRIFLYRSTFQPPGSTREVDIHFVAICERMRATVAFSHSLLLTHFVRRLSLSLSARLLVSCFGFRFPSVHTDLEARTKNQGTHNLGDNIASAVRATVFACRVGHRRCRNNRTHENVARATGKVSEPCSSQRPTCPSCCSVILCSIQPRQSCHWNYVSTRHRFPPTIYH